MSTEEWRPVVGYQGYYEVSDLGRVRSVDRVVTKAVPTRIKGRMMATVLDTYGRYTAVKLYRDGRVRNAKVHTLVLTAFVGPRPENMQGCHNDGNPANNQLSNLRWDTQSGNQLDAVEHGTHAKTRKTHCDTGHPLSGDNLRIWMRNGRPTRVCRACAERRREAYQPKEVVSAACPRCDRVVRRASLGRHMRRCAVSGPQRDHEARAREVLLPEVFAAERDRFIDQRDHGGEGGQ